MRQTPLDGQKYWEDAILGMHEIPQSHNQKIKIKRLAILGRIIWPMAAIFEAKLKATIDNQEPQNHPFSNVVFNP